MEKPYHIIGKDDTQGLARFLSKNDLPPIVVPLSKLTRVPLTRPAKLDQLKVEDFASAWSLASISRQFRA